MITKINNSNDYSKRTANSVKGILKSNNIDCKVWNTGDNRNFEICLEPNIKNLMIIKRLGFIRTDTSTGSIFVNCF